MIRSFGSALFCAALAASTTSAQSLTQRITQTDGTVEVVFPSRPGVCGDGEFFIRNLFGNDGDYVSYGGYRGPDNRWDRPCVPGPARVVATVAGGQVSRLQTYVGPEASSRADMRHVDASGEDASAWLASVIKTGAPRPASDAVLPLLIANAAPPWSTLIAVTRDEDRPRNVRKMALTWLATGVSDHLGLRDSRDESDDDQMREQAVFAISQRHSTESVPELIDVAKSSPHASARRAAIFWLGQSGDKRAVDLFESLLRR